MKGEEFGTLREMVEFEKRENSDKNPKPATEPLHWHWDWNLGRNHGSKCLVYWAVGNTNSFLFLTYLLLIYTEIFPGLVLSKDRRFGGFKSGLCQQIFFSEHKILDHKSYGRDLSGEIRVWYFRFVEDPESSGDLKAKFISHSISKLVPYYMTFEEMDLFSDTQLYPPTTECNYKNWVLKSDGPYGPIGSDRVYR